MICDKFWVRIISRIIFQKYVAQCALSSEVGNAALKQTELSWFAKCNHGATATEKKFCWVLWSFLISSVNENLNPVSLQQTADVFPEHVPQGAFRLFYNAEYFFFNAENTLLLLLRIQRYMWWITTPHVGIFRTMCGLQSKNFVKTKRTRQKEHTRYLFISFWQSVLAKYALELGHHTIYEQSRCCVQ